MVKNVPRYLRDFISPVQMFRRGKKFSSSIVFVQRTVLKTDYCSKTSSSWHVFQLSRGNELSSKRLRNKTLISRSYRFVFNVPGLINYLSIWWCHRHCRRFSTARHENSLLTSLNFIALIKTFAKVGDMIYTAVSVLHVRSALHGSLEVISMVVLWSLSC